MLKRYGLPTLYLLVVFLCGSVVGVFGYRLYELRIVSAAPSRPSPEEWKKRHLQEMQSRLHLDPGQVSQLSGIMDRTRDQMRSVMVRNEPEMDAIQAEQFSSIKGILRPNQVAEYEKYHAEREQRRAAARRNF